MKTRQLSIEEHKFMNGNKVTPGCILCGAGGSMQTFLENKILEQQQAQMMSHPAL